MHHSAPILILFLAGAALLAFAALHDVGFRTVPNRVSVALLAIGILLRLLQHDLPAGLGCGAAVFAITYLFWRFGWMGGADVKLLSSAAIVVAPIMVPSLVIATSLAGGVLALIYIVGSRMVPQPAHAYAMAGQGLRWGRHRAARPVSSNERRAANCAGCAAADPCPTPPPSLSAAGWRSPAPDGRFLFTCFVAFPFEFFN